MASPEHGLRTILGSMALLAAALLELSCTANRMYRTVSLEQLPGYSLAFIELDDQGELWSPAQVDRALAHLEHLNQSEAGVALVLFVHGWNSDASPRAEKEGKTLYRFRAMLARLDEGIRQELPDRRVPVMGIYLAWRGRVSSVPLLREASFFGRRGAAERISGAVATDAIYRILGTLRQNPASRSVLIGHSFGSMILERALAQAVVSELLSAPDMELLFPADLVVLLNPAGSASQTKQLVDILARNRLKTYRFDANGNRFERPLLVSFTSESDRPTRLFFPFGMFFKAMTKRFRQYGQETCSPISNQRRLYTHTAGHLPELHSHEVEVSAKPERPPAQAPPGRTVPSFLRYEETYDPVTRQIAFSFDGEKNRFTIKRKPVALNDTPYWIMRVPRELIPNHSAVLTEDAFRLVEAVLVLSATYDAGVRTIVEREDGVRPVAIVPRPDGTALFVDRSRGVYSVSRDSTRPVFLSCLSAQIDPSNAIGFHVAADFAYAVFSVRQGVGASGRCATDLYQFEIDDEGYRQRNQVRFAGSECFVAATVDLQERRVLLSLDHPSGISEGAGSELWIADLTEETPRPRRLFGLPSEPATTVLLFESSRRRLFAAQRESGALWEIDLLAPAPRPRRIEGDLGWPVALAYSRVDQRLYVTDTKGARIWVLDCGEGCGEPEVFLQSGAIEDPTTLAVTPDGTLWLGDPQSQTLQAIAPDGSITTTIHSLSGTTARAGSPGNGEGAEGWEK